MDGPRHPQLLPPARRPDRELDANTLTSSALPIARDDPAAKKEVTEFLDALGWDTIDTGTLAESWCIEPVPPVHAQPYVGEASAGLSPTESFFWAVQAPGFPVPAARGVIPERLVSPSAFERPEGLCFTRR